MTEKMTEFVLKNYKKHAITAAKDLGYGAEVILKIKQATSDIQVNNILIDARKGLYG